MGFDALGNGLFSTSSTTLGKTTSNNLFCSIYLTGRFDNDVYPRNKDNVFARAPNGTIWFYDSSKASLNGTQFAQSLVGQYLFYETESEVADIENVVDIESGGTITTDSEVLANIELSVKCK